MQEARHLYTPDDMIPYYRETIAAAYAAAVPAGTEVKELIWAGRYGNILQAGSVYIGDPCYMISGRGDRKPISERDALGVTQEAYYQDYCLPDTGAEVVRFGAGWAVFIRTGSDGMSPIGTAMDTACVGFVSLDRSAAERVAAAVYAVLEAKRTDILARREKRAAEKADYWIAIVSRPSAFRVAKAKRGEGRWMWRQTTSGVQLWCPILKSKLDEPEYRAKLLKDAGKVSVEVVHESHCAEVDAAWRAAGKAMPALTPYSGEPLESFPALC